MFIDEMYMSKVSASFGSLQGTNFTRNFLSPDVHITPSANKSWVANYCSMPHSNNVVSNGGYIIYLPQIHVTVLLIL